MAAPRFYTQILTLFFFSFSFLTPPSPPLPPPPSIYSCWQWNFIVRGAIFSKNSLRLGAEIWAWCIFSCSASLRGDGGGTRRCLHSKQVFKSVARCSASNPSLPSVAAAVVAEVRDPVEGWLYMTSSFFCRRTATSKGGRMRGVSTETV